MSSHTQKFLNKNFPILIYFFSLSCLMMTLYYARNYGLLPRPIAGTDQLGMLEAAENMSNGKLPDAGYMYSYLYTAFLYILHLLAKGNPIIMRILQAGICALIPVFIYKLCLRLRLGTPCGQLAALLYCFYGPAILISLSFLRAGPLTLCFILAAYYLTLAYIEKKRSHYVKAGICMAMCILGRENFIPVAVAPALMLFYPSIRRHVKKTYILHYAIGIAVLLIPVIIYNFVAFGSLSLVPGHWQNVMDAYHSEVGSSTAGTAAGTAASILTNIPTQIVNYLCSYEIPNSLSFYAHREVIEFLRIFTVPFNFLTAMSITAVCFKLRSKAIIFTALLIAVYAGSMLPFEMFYRFRIPSAPLLCCLCSAVIIGLIREFNRKKYGRAIGCLVLFLFLFITTMRDTYVLRPISEKRGAVLVLIQNKRFHAAELLIGKMPPSTQNTLELKTYLMRALHANDEKARAMKLYKQWSKKRKKTPSSPKRR